MKWWRGFLTYRAAVEDFMRKRILTAQRKKAVPEKILVTGGSGFIGSHLCEALLSSGRAVVSVDNFNGFYDPRIKKKNEADIGRHPNAGRFKSFHADIRDARAMSRIFKAQNPDAVIHLAAMAGVRPSIDDPRLYEDVNIGGTGILLDLCRRSGIFRFLFASSSSVYGNNRKVPFSESDRVDHPISPYAATKKAGELMCHTYHHLFGMSIACLRFFTVYGPRQRPDLAIHKFTRHILRSEPIPFYGDGSTRRDYTYIDDIVGGILKALAWTAQNRQSRYGIFNLGGSRTVSLSQMVACLERVTGKKAGIRRLPMQPGDVLRTNADLSRSRKVLGYRPATDFEKGVARFVDWYRKTADGN